MATERSRLNREKRELRQRRPTAGSDDPYAALNVVLSGRAVEVFEPANLSLRWRGSSATAHARDEDAHLTPE